MRKPQPKPEPDPEAADGPEVISGRRAIRLTREWWWKQRRRGPSAEDSWKVDYDEPLLPSVSIKLGESGKVLPIGEKTVQGLKRLYAVASAKDPAPPFSLATPLVAPADGFQKIVAASLDKVVGIKSGGGAVQGLWPSPVA